MAEKKTSGPKQLKITQIRSGIGRQEQHRRTLRALGIKKHQQTVIQEDTPAIRGMLAKVGFMVHVEEVEHG